MPSDTSAKNLDCTTLLNTLGKAQTHSNAQLAEKQSDPYIDVSKASDGDIAKAGIAQNLTEKGEITAREPTIIPGGDVLRKDGTRDIGLVGAVGVERVILN